MFILVRSQIQRSDEEVEHVERAGKMEKLEMNG